MMLLTDMWLLATRNLTMTALCIVYGLAEMRWPLVGLFFLPACFHLSSAIITNGDLLLRKTYAGQVVWGFTLSVFVGMVLFAILKVYFEGPNAAIKEPDVFDYRDVIGFLLSSIVGVYLIGVSTWSALPSLTYTELCTAFYETLLTKEAGKPALLIGLLYAVSVKAPDGEWLVSLCILASCAWVMRYMLGTPPERKAKTALKTAEGAA